MSYGGPDATRGVVMIFDGSILGMSVVLGAPITAGQVEFFFRVNGQNVGGESIVFAESDVSSRVIQLATPVPVTSGDLVAVGVRESNFPGDFGVTRDLYPRRNSAGVVIMIQQ